MVTSGRSAREPRLRPREKVRWACREARVSSDVSVNAPIGARERRKRSMKFMLMMNAPRGNGEWAVGDWSSDDLKAHMGFMKKFASELQSEGAWVDGQGLAAPGQARIV